MAGRERRSQLTEAAINRRGRLVDCTVQLSCLLGDGETRGVILMMDVLPLDGADGRASAGSALENGAGEVTGAVPEGTTAEQAACVLELAHRLTEAAGIAVLGASG